MQIKFLGTGSSGNCICIETGSTTILIDIGIPKTKVEKKLIEAGINPGNIDAIFLTHSHGDHVAGLPLAAKWNIPVYGSSKTVEIHDGETQPLLADRMFYLTDDVFVIPFRTHHNDFESFGYAVSNGEQKVSVCLDTGKVDNDMIQAMRGSSAYVIESNHDYDKTILDTTRPESVKQRNLGEYGHLSNDQTAEALCKLITGKGEHIYLAHLSSACNSPALAKMTVVNALKRKGFEFGKHYKMAVV